MRGAGIGDDGRRQPKCRRVFGDAVSPGRTTYASIMMCSMKRKEGPGPTLIDSTGMLLDLSAIQWFVECDWYSWLVSVSSHLNSLLDFNFEKCRRHHMHKNPTTTIP